MSRELQQRFDVLVVGGGPAGMAAAARAAESGAGVGIADDNVPESRRANLAGESLRIIKVKTARDGLAVHCKLHGSRRSAGMSDI